MRNIRLKFAIAVWLGACSLALVVGADKAESQKSSKVTHLDLARVLVRELRPENTSYQHKQGYIKWKGEDGAEAYESRVDCSGLLNSLLERAYGLTPDDFEKWLGKHRPLAKEYFDAITTQKNFRLITTVGSVRPGDVIAIRYPPGTNDNTGHIMIIAGVPTARKASKPEVDGTEQFEVSVIDSSESGHGRTDTRRKQDGTFGDGVGQGVFRLYASPNGEIVGYTWSTFANSDYYDQNTRQLVIGRLKLTP
jgi:hypothetical protein